jgi:hypothetical protein
MIVISGATAALQKTVNIRGETISLASISDREVGIVSGSGRDAHTINVDATTESVLVAVARLNPDFDTMKKILTTLEDNGNLQFKIAWLE